MRTCCWSDGRDHGSHVFLARADRSSGLRGVVTPALRILIGLECGTGETATIVNNLSTNHLDALCGDVDLAAAGTFLLRAAKMDVSP